MNTHDFIVKNIREQLERSGVKAAVAAMAANEALDYYKRTAHFKRNALEDCLKHAKRRAKELAA